MQGDQSRCIYCGRVLVVATRPAHVFPNGAGGRLTTTTTVCNECNNSTAGIEGDFCLGLAQVGALAGARKLIETGPLPHPVAAFIVREMLSGLGYIHEPQDLGRDRVRRGLVHRDVSPHNVPVVVRPCPGEDERRSLSGARADGRAAAAYTTGAPMTITFRELDPTADRRAIEAIDTSFETETVFDLVTTSRRIDLVERRLEKPLTKRYSIEEVFAGWTRWDTGWVADDGDVRGFAAVEHEPWHARLVLWFFYIQPAWRRRGIGRGLLERVEAYGRNVGASHVWLETSNVNVPGVTAYNRLGYTLCGADRLHYESTMPEETAIFLAKML